MRNVQVGSFPLISGTIVEFYPKNRAKSNPEILSSRP